MSSCLLASDSWGSTHASSQLIATCVCNSTRCKMVDEIDDRALRDDVYADEPNLWQYFVEVRRGGVARTMT